MQVQGEERFLVKVDSEGEVHKICAVQGGSSDKKGRCHEPPIPLAPVDFHECKYAGHVGFESNLTSIAKIGLPCGGLVPPSQKNTTTNAVRSQSLFTCQQPFRAGGDPEQPYPNNTKFSSGFVLKGYDYDKGDMIIWYDIEIMQACGIKL